MTTMIVMTRTPALHGKARDYGWGYLKIALVEIDPAQIPEGRTEPAMISERSIGVVKVHECQSLYFGKGIRSQGKAFIDRCRKLAAKFNG